MIIRLTIKSALAGGCIYYSYKHGVWGDSKQTTELYNKISDHLDPHVKTVRSKIPLELPNLPASGEITFLGKHYYNEGVKNTIHFVHRLPCYIGQWTKKGTDAIKSALDAPPPAK